MFLDAKVLVPTYALEDNDTFITFLSGRCREITFRVVQEGTMHLGGDFSNPIAVAVKFRDGEVMLWDPWALKHED